MQDRTPRIDKEINEAEEACRQMQKKPNVLMAVIFKERPSDEVVNAFVRGEAQGWNMTFFQGNPHLKK